MRKSKSDCIDKSDRSDMRNCMGKGNTKRNNIFGRVATAIAAIVVAVGCFACSEKEDFTVKGVIKAAVTGNESVADNGGVIAGHSGALNGPVKMYYYAQGGVKSVDGTMTEGKFKLHGVSATPTLVTLVIPGVGGAEYGSGSGYSEGLPYYVVAQNGETIEIEGTAGNPWMWSVKGNKASRAMADFARENGEAIAAGDYGRINSAVARYVASHKGDIGAAAILTTRFHVPGYEMLADSLLRLLKVEARPAAVMQNFGSVLGRQVSSESHGDIVAMAVYAGRDSVVRLTPSRQSYGLLAFTSEKRGDSIRRRLSLMYDSLPERRFRALEISLAPDSASWRSSVERDSVAWPQAWLPGGVAAPQIAKLSVPRLPYFIVCDSTGHQIYRGSSVTAATDEVMRRLGVKF